MNNVTTARRTIDTRRIHTRMIPLVRVVLGASILAVLLLDSIVSGRALTLFDGLLVVYVLCAFFLYVLTRMNSPIVRKISIGEHWLDAGTFLMLAIGSGGAAHLFLCGLFFSFLVASFRWGTATAVRVSSLSTFIYAVWLLANQMRAQRVQLDVLLIPVVTLLVLGAMVAYWGGFEILLKRRLEFLSGITRISNPRFGAEHVIGSFMEQLRAFYNADTCLILMSEPGESEICLRRADRSGAVGGARAEPIPRDVASRLLLLPAGIGVVRSIRTHLGFLPKTRYFEYDIPRGVRSLESREASEKLATNLDAESLLTVPLRYHNDALGRIYVTSARGGFEESDIYFLIQVAEHLMPIIDNIRLVDRMATDAGLAERKRIARDLHDSVIQPYVGLKLGVASLREKHRAGTLQEVDIDHLISVNEQAIDDLRFYVSALKGDVEQDGDFLAAVRRYAAKFSFATGIAVEIEAGEKLAVNERLAAEAFQIIAEGLSNIRRHTESMKAWVRIDCHGGQLVVRIADMCSGSKAAGSFLPHSITERAEALGGCVRIEQYSQGGCAVVVQIPL